MSCVFLLEVKIWLLENLRQVPFSNCFWLSLITSDYSYHSLVISTYFHLSFSAFVPFYFSLSSVAFSPFLHIRLVHVIAHISAHVVDASIHCPGAGHYLYVCFCALRTRYPVLRVTPPFRPPFGGRWTLEGFPTRARPTASALLLRGWVWGDMNDYECRSLRSLSSIWRRNLRLVDSYAPLPFGSPIVYIQVTFSIWML